MQGNLETKINVNGVFADEYHLVTLAGCVWRVSPAKLKALLQEWAERKPFNLADYGVRIGTPLDLTFITHDEARDLVSNL